ncbi:N-acetylmannosamine kinase [Sulfitobacter sp. THAF37]|uniref:ROK family transcriptional regulator n=1 Tax=Sulfitobacter sp. THAF37 TaxID=2587855 RepID=UPI0012687B00|nr:ROK family transcriptional regulator [Sulfitobacter sp. THAF37]QFT59225.1 N-acetylmannosamine kinase [Sulfitobacter sp. THAF37]
MNKTDQISAARRTDQSGLRNVNERLILSQLQRHGAMPGSDLARQTGLSAQTVSVILRKLKSDGLTRQGKPVRGKVGKPSVPIALNPLGALSVGCKLGRRSCDLIVMDFCGATLFKRNLTYDIAIPQTVFAFLADSYADARAQIGPKAAERLCGFGIAAPFEIWKWGASDGNTPEDFLSWKDLSFEEEVARFTDLPVFMLNDATSACWAEQLYGRGRDFSDYAYFFVSTFIGGGIVLNQSVYEGSRGNAGSFAPLRVGNRAGQTRQLLDVASVHVLEDALAKAGKDYRELWRQPQDWSRFEAEVSDWIDGAAHAIAQACMSACAVIDFEAVIIDGALPQDVRHRLVEAVRVKLPDEDSRGLLVPEVAEGVIGGEARALGAACDPIYSQFFTTTQLV